LPFFGVEDRDAHARGSEKIVFAVTPMAEGAKTRADGREDPPAGHKLVVDFRGGGDQSDSEDTNSRRGGEEFSKFPMHGFSDYRECPVVASLVEKMQ
jgi:hypothetical protein